MIPNRALMQERRGVVGEDAKHHTLLSLTLRGVIARDMVNPKGKFPAEFNTYKVVEPGDVVFQQGDVGDLFFMILEGEAEVCRSLGEALPHRLGTLHAGEYFGEQALLAGESRSATVRALTPLTVLALRQREFTSLVTQIPELRRSIEQVMERRRSSLPE